MYLFSRTKNGDQLKSSNPSAAAATREPDDNEPAPKARGDARTTANLEVLGLPPGARWDEITDAHARLVSDLTPGLDASHRNVALAEQFLHEVNEAFASLRLQSVSAKSRIAG